MSLNRFFCSRWLSPKHTTSVGAVPRFRRTRCQGRVRKRHPRIFYRCLTHGALRRERQNTLRVVFLNAPQIEIPSLSMCISSWLAPVLSMVINTIYFASFLDGPISIINPQPPSDAVRIRKKYFRRSFQFSIVII